MSAPKNQMLNLAERFSIPESLTRNAVVPFLDEKSLYALSWTCKDKRNQYQDKHADKKVAAEMLNCVLNPTLSNQAQFLKLLSMPKQDKNGQALYLIQNHGEEVYFNKDKVRKTKTIRYSTNVLEAILRTKNFHLAKTLFNCIPAHEKTEDLKKYISLITSQDMWGMPELQLAYKNFLGPGQALYDAGNWDALNKLCGRIGQALKEHLPWFSIYLFCHPMYHANADYTKAPNWSCVLWDNSELDLDSLGASSIFALYKGGLARGCLGLRFGRWHGLDSAAFLSQCTVLSLEMDKTIKQYGLDDLELDASKKFCSR